MIHQQTQVPKAGSLAEPPRRGIREDPGREQLCTQCILSPEISDTVCVRGRLPLTIHFPLYVDFGNSQSPLPHPAPSSSISVQTILSQSQSNYFYILPSFHFITVRALCDSRHALPLNFLRISLYCYCARAPCLFKSFCKSARKIFSLAHRPRGKQALITCSRSRK